MGRRGILTVGGMLPGTLPGHLAVTAAAHLTRRRTDGAQRRWPRAIASTLRPGIPPPGRSRDRTREEGPLLLLGQQGALWSARGYRAFGSIMQNSVTPLSASRASHARRYASR